MAAPESIHQLVAKFTENREAYRSGKYNEAQLRQQFLDPFFEALGWDIYNRAGVSPEYQDVKIEDALQIDGASKAPDYTFRIGKERKFYVEAKKPAVDIQYDIHPAYQLKRYAWNAHLPLGILTDFEEFAVYNCKNKPNPSDSAATGRDLFYKYTEYVDKWDEIAAIFSKDAVWKGSFDRYAETSKGKKGTTEVDDDLLESIESWRKLLALNIALRNPQVADEAQLNFAVQMTIDRILFLRICEDRGIEPEEQFKSMLEKPGIYSQMVELFKRADMKYNSGLFHFTAEKGTSAADTFTPGLSIDDKVLKEIIKDIYYPCPYIFKEIPVEILGQVYEQFLGKVIRLTAGGHAKVEEKPEVRKAGGVYYTPKYIVDYIVQNTVGKLLEGKTPTNAAELKIVDPACGSGSFLLGAYQYLLDWHLKWYLADGAEKWSKGRTPALVAVSTLSGGSAQGSYKLTTAKKKEILVNNIHGVDIDAQAVEVTKLSLLLKVLEEESGQLSLGLERALPDLGRNIQCGNSLIGEDYFAGQLIVDDKERQRVNPFEWERAFPSVFSKGGFDAVIGNPPYVFARNEGFTVEEKRYFYEKYPNQEYQLNTYSIFSEMAIGLIRYSGHFGFIIPNNWLTIGTMKNFRKFILQSGCQIDIVNNFYKVFHGANIDTSILTFAKKKSDFVRLYSSSRPNEVILIEMIDTDELLRKQIINIKSNQGAVNNSILEKINKRSFPLENFAKIKAGLKAYETGKGTPKQTDEMKKKRIYHSSTRVDSSFRIYLDGKDVQRYQISWSGMYLKYGKNLAAPRDRCLFDGKRIVVRQIPSKPPYSINGAVIDGEELNDINSMIIIQTGFIPLEFLLGIINSRLTTYWFIQVFDKFQRKIFPQFKVNELAQFPIPILNLSDQKQSMKVDLLTSLVDRIIDLKKRNPATPQEQERLAREIESTDREIDRLVYTLYGLSAEEIKIVEGS